MKWLTMCLLAVGLAFAGCSKSEKPTADAPPTRVPIDVPKLRDAFAAANEQTKAIATQAVRAIQSDNWDGAGAALEKLATVPGVTDEQKKIITEVLEQLKTNIARQSAPPAK
jgi:hypothetical protein